MDLMKMGLTATPSRAAGAVTAGADGQIVAAGKLEAAAGSSSAVDGQASKSTSSSSSSSSSTSRSDFILSG